MGVPVFRLTAQNRRALRGFGYRLRYECTEIAVHSCTAKAFLKKRFCTPPIPHAVYSVHWRMDAI